MHPRLLQANLNYSDGILVMTFSEDIDNTPGDVIVDGVYRPGDIIVDGVSVLSLGTTDTSKLALNNVSGGADIRLDSNVVETNVDKNALTLTLSDRQRVNAIALSSTPGGDGSALVLDAAAAAVRDLATNPNPGDSVTVIEVADTVLPSPLAATIDYSVGIMKISFSEIIDLTPSEQKVDPSKIRISNSSGESDTSARIDIIGAATVIEYDDSIVTLRFSEAQRALAIALSGTPGGDGVAVVLDIFTNAFFDVAGNSHLETLGVAVSEIPDTILPNITSAKIYLSDGRLELTADETLDITAASDKVNPITGSSLI